MAVRCKECQYVAAKDEGYCPDCGAMYDANPEIVDDSLVGQTPVRSKPVKKKGGGLFSSLFGGSKSEAEHAPARHAVPAGDVKETPLPEGVDRKDIQIRCQECKETTQIDNHDGYCPGCGAFYVQPFTYITPQSQAAEREALQAEIDKQSRPKKTFDEMNDMEKLEHLNEKVNDTWDQLIRDRHDLNVKANECMQCFTAAGTIKSDDQFEVMASTVKQRYQNLEDFEMLNREYRQLLDQFSAIHDKLVAARDELLTHQQKVKQAQGVS